MAIIRSYKELRAYQIAFQEAMAIFELSKRFPSSERYGLTNQIRRSSRAVCALIAEAWASRRYEKAFVSKLVQALGEAVETRVWLDFAVHCGYLTEEEFTERDNAWEHVGAMLYRMISRVESFTRRPQFTSTKSDK